MLTNGNELKVEIDNRLNKEKVIMVYENYWVPKDISKKLKIQIYLTMIRPLCCPLWLKNSQENRTNKARSVWEEDPEKDFWVV